MPGPGDLCRGCNRLLCRWEVEPDPEDHYMASCEAGHEACQADGYCERPMMEWVYLTGSRLRWGADEKRVVHLMVPLRFDELTWRRYHASAQGYRRWFERRYGHDLEAYLAGYDDAGAGLPSAAQGPDGHTRAEAALDGYGPPVSGEVITCDAGRAVSEEHPQRTEDAEVEDWLPFYALR